MNITRVTATPISYRIPPERRVSLGIGQTVKRDAVIVKIDTDSGASGWGEAHAARAPTAIGELINTTLAQLVTGMDPLDTEAVWARVYRMQLASHGAGAAAAIGLSGIDMALWDLRGKVAGKPVCELLGGRTRRLKSYAGGISLGFQPVDELLAEVDRLLERGYRALKLRLGDTVEKDSERVRAVRHHVGQEIDILTDVNTAYELEQVIELLPCLDECAVGWLEEPFPAHAYKSYIAAGSAGATPLAAGENHYLRFDFERLRDDGAVTVWQPDASKCGGVSELMRIATMAEAAGCVIHPHTSVTRLNMAASIHALSALKAPGYFEAEASSFNPFRDSLCAGGFIQHEDSTVEALNRPGLGVEIDESGLAEYRAIPGPGYV